MNHSQLTELTTIEGRTISAAIEGFEDRLLLVFTDKTYLLVGLIHIDPDEIELDYMTELHPIAFPNADLVRAGLYTNEELEERAVEWREMCESETKERELAELARLKAKYPDV